MNIAHPLNYHYYSYRKPYFAYLILYFVFLFVSITSFKHLENFYKYLSAILLLVSFVFTIINSVYEFTLLIVHYLNLKTIKFEFYISSIIYSIINAFIHVLLLFIAGLIIKHAFNQDINQILGFDQFQIYLFTFFLHICLFSIIGIISLLLKKIKFVQILLYTIVLVIVGLISFEITAIVVQFIHTLYTNSELILKLYPLIIIITISTWLLIFLKILKIDQ